MKFNPTSAMTSLVIFGLLVLIGCNSTEPSGGTGPITPGTYYREFTSFTFATWAEGFDGDGSARREIDFNANGTWYQRQYITYAPMSLSNLLQNESHGKWSANDTSITTWGATGRRLNAVTQVWGKWESDTGTYVNPFQNVTANSIDLWAGSEFDTWYKK